MRWAGHVACIGERRGVYGVWSGGLKVRDHWENLDVRGRITLTWTFDR